MIFSFYLNSIDNIINYGRTHFVETLTIKFMIKNVVFTAKSHSLCPFARGSALTFEFSVAFQAVGPRVGQVRPDVYQYESTSASPSPKSTWPMPPT